MIFSGQFRVLHGIFNSHCGQLPFRMQESHGIAILIILLSNWARSKWASFPDSGGVTVSTSFSHFIMGRVLE